MGRFTAQAEFVLKRRIDSGESVAEARHRIQTGCERRIAERKDAIEEVLHRFSGNPPEEWRAVIGNEEHFIALEKEWMREFDNFKDDDFAN